MLCAFASAAPTGVTFRCRRSSITALPGKAARLYNAAPLFGRRCCIFRLGRNMTRRSGGEPSLQRACCRRQRVSPGRWKHAAHGGGARTLWRRAGPRRPKGALQLRTRCVAAAPMLPAGWPIGAVSFSSGQLVPKSLPAGLPRWRRFCSTLCLTAFPTLVPRFQSHRRSLPLPVLCRYGRDRGGRMLFQSIRQIGPGPPFLTCCRRACSSLSSHLRTGVEICQPHRRCADLL